MNRRRVVITGIGSVTPMGNDVQSTWQGVLDGSSGVARITHFDPSGFPAQIAGEVKSFDFSTWVKRDPILKHAKANTKFALVASEEAIKDSGLDWENLDAKRKGIYFAAGDSEGSVDVLGKAFHKAWQANGSSFDLAAYLEERAGTGDGVVECEKEPAQTLRHMVKHFGARGPVYNCLTACAASAQAIGEAVELIRHGDADIMLSGGSHSMIHPFGIAGFCLLTTLSVLNDTPEQASRPFDATRSGFVLSEGAGAVILEEYEHAKKRGATIYAELAGYGTTADAYRLTDSHPEGIGASAALEMAIKDSGVALTDVDYLNAHGTSTKVNDAVETIAIKKIFGEHAKDLWVSSTKSMTGHLIAAAGVVELIICLLAMRDGVAPPTINYKHKDPDCDLDYIPNQSRQKEINVCASNSFGFGGQNIVLVVKKT
ncbi:MAG: 3-oxoacyl-[acyl-carrier-protein] synthase II [Candidatus Omnitrophota bacterium]|jgi:3-oxoacyl-[acyl-carrier-protein] synthase II